MKKVLYIFGQLTDEDIEWLIANGKKERFMAGSVIIQKGNRIDMLYIGLDGKFSVFYGEKLLTTSNPDVDHDQRLFERLRDLKDSGMAIHYVVA